MTTEPNRRERKKQRTRTELVAAARELIAESGVAELRVSDITDRVDVALGTFYSYFDGKDDVVEAVVAEALRPLADAVGDYGDTADDPAIATAVGVTELIRTCSDDPQLARLLIRLEDAEPRFERILWDRAAPIIRRAIETEHFTVGRNDTDLVVKVAIAAVFAAIKARSELEIADAPKDVAVLVLQMLGVDHERAAAIVAQDLPVIAPGRSAG